MGIEDFIWDGEKDVYEADPEEVMKAVYRHQGFVYANIRVAQHIREYMEQFSSDLSMDTAIGLNYVLTMLHLDCDPKLSCRS